MAYEGPHDSMSETHNGSCLLQAQQHCSTTQPEHWATHVRELVQTMAVWAKTHKLELACHPNESKRVSRRLRRSYTKHRRSQLAGKVSHCSSVN